MFHFQLEPETGAPKPLDDAELFGRRTSLAVEPGSAVEAHRFDDQRLAFPATCRVSLPRRLRILGERAAVGKDLAVGRARFLQNDHQVG